MSKLTANQIIEKWYKVPRPVSDEEVIHELVNLRRKIKKGNLDDTQVCLYEELVNNGMLKYPELVKQG